MMKELAWMGVGGAVALFIREIIADNDYDDEDDDDDEEIVATPTRPQTLSDLMKSISMDMNNDEDEENFEQVMSDPKQLMKWLFKTLELSTEGNAEVDKSTGSNYLKQFLLASMASGIKAEDLPSSFHSLHINQFKQLLAAIVAKGIKPEDLLAKVSELVNRKAATNGDITSRLIADGWH